MAKKNHIIKSFKVSEELYQAFDEAAMKTSLKKSELSRLLFNRALMQLRAAGQKEGWDNLKFSVKELS